MAAISRASSRSKCAGASQGIRPIHLALILVCVALQSTHAGTLASVSPGNASAGITLTIIGTGFDTTAAANNTVTFTPATGAAVSTPAGSVLAITSTQQRLTVKVPAGLPTGTTALLVTNRTTGEQSAGRSIALITAALDVGTAAPGSTVTVTITGSPNTQLTTGATRVTFSGTGLTVNSTTVRALTTVVVNLTVAATAPTGPRDVSIASGSLLALLPGAFTVATASPTNQAPVVIAGPAQTITLPATASLAGTVSDDGLPVGGTLTSTWSKVSGPGTVTFGNPASPATTATFSAAGTYMLQLSASDTQLTTNATVTITVNPAPPTNQPPVVSAGAAQTITLPANATLTGTVTDDGLPVGGTLTSTCSKLSPPGTVTFANAASPATTATFSQAGPYVLQLSATDTLLTTTATVAITVNPANQPPVVTASATPALTLPAAATLTGTVTDDGLPIGGSLTGLWTKVSGPGNVTFGNPAASSTTATFDKSGTYVLRLTGNDSQLASSAGVTIAVNGPPTAQPGGPYSGTTQQPILFNGGGSTDPDNDPLSYAWDFGDGESAAGVSPSHVFTTAKTFTVVLTVSDGRGGISKAATTSVIAAPTAGNHPPVVSAGGPYSGAVGQSVSLSATATDPDNDPLSYFWDFGDKSNGTGASPGHTYTSAGQFSVSVTVSDGRGGVTSATTTASISGAGNHAPVFTSSPVITAKHQFAYSYQATASDADNDALTFSLATAPDGMTVDANTGVVQWTPTGPNQVGAESVTLVVTDVHNASATQSFDIAVVDVLAPVVTLLAPAETLPGSSVTVTALATDDVAVTGVTLLVDAANPTALQAPPYQLTISVPSTAIA